MSDPVAPAELINHLCRNSRLTEGEAEHVVAEVLCYYSESVEDFVRRRHQELQTQGLSNNVIFSALANEVQLHRFVGKPLTIRQIRRAIYG